MAPTGFDRLESRSHRCRLAPRLVRRLQAGPDMDDGERAAMGITAGDRDGTPEGPPVHRLEAGATMVVSVDTCQRLQQTIAFADEATRCGTCNLSASVSGCTMGLGTGGQVACGIRPSRPAWWGPRFGSRSAGPKGALHCPRPDERAELPVDGHAHAVRGRLPGRRPLTSLTQWCQGRKG